MPPQSEDTDSSRADAKSAEQPNSEDVGDVPDPDEDDLDDLDDLLDDFSAAKIESNRPHNSAAGPDRPSTGVPASGKKESKAEEGDVLSEDEVWKQLQAGIDQVMGEMDMDDSPDMQAQFETIFNELGAAPASAGGLQGAKSSSSFTVPDPSFQDTIRRTMERMQTSGDQATAAAQSEGSDDFMAELLKRMQAAELGEGGLDDSNENLSKLLLGMMEQLTNKDILYEPMKELNDKLPEWMEKNQGKISEEDRKRYALQEGYVKEIVAKFEESTYSDANPADREYIVDRMQKMQAAGSPPPDLVGDMPSAQEALGVPDAESCNPQ